MEDKISQDDRLKNLENNMESCFFALLTLKTSKKSIETVLELSVLEYFDVKRVDFHRLDVGHFGDAKVIPEDVKRVIKARQWFMSIMYNQLHRTSYDMGKNFKFYHHKKEIAHRPVYLSALNPKTIEDQKNASTYHAICSIVRRICLEEDVFDERFAL